MAAPTKPSILILQSLFFFQIIIWMWEWSRTSITVSQYWGPMVPPSCYSAFIAGITNTDILEGFCVKTHHVHCLGLPCLHLSTWPLTTGYVPVTVVVTGSMLACLISPPETTIWSSLIFPPPLNKDETPYRKVWDLAFPIATEEARWSNLELHKWILTSGVQKTRGRQQIHFLSTFSYHGLSQDFIYKTIHSLLGDIPNG